MKGRVCEEKWIWGNELKERKKGWIYKKVECVQRATMTLDALTIIDI